jgi:DNA-binding NtrC family response regulator
LAEEGRNPVVWIIDRQHWPRALLRAELIERGFDALGYEEVADALAALHHPRTGRPQVIVLEVREQDLNQDTLGLLVEAGVPIVVLGGIPELDEPAIQEFAWAAVMRRPFTLGAAADKVEELTGR